MEKHKLIPFLTAALCVSSFSAFAGVATSRKTEVEVVEEKSLCDTIFDLPTLYKDKENPFLQKFAIIGRYHGQYYFLDSNQGNDDDWDKRRSRLGAAADLFGFVKLQFNFNLNVDGGGRFFEDLEDATLQLKVTDEFKLTLGKQKAPISHEWRTSSNKIVTFERSRIINQAVPNKMGGILGSYEKHGLLLDLGAYTNTLDGDWAYPTFDGGFSLFGSVGYKADFGTTRFEYLYSDIDEDQNNATRGIEYVFSLNYHGKWDKLQFVADAIYAVGSSDVSDIYGLILMPTYDITDKLRFVFRYQIAGSDSDDGFSLQSRYEREAPELVTKKGDFYQAIYAGLNYYICGDILKLMAGIEYTDFDQAGGSSYDAWTLFTGVRVSF